MTATIIGATQRPVWWAYAACLGVDPRLMFPDHGETAQPAKKVCARCVVRTVCRDWAIANDEAYGVWGGMTRDERRKEATLRRRRLRLEAIDTGAVGT